MRWIKQKLKWLLPALIAGLMLVACEQTASDSDNAESVAEALYAAFPDYDIPVDGCRGMTWGQEEGILILSLQGLEDYGVVVFEGTPLCAGLIGDLAEEATEACDRLIDENDILDSLQQDGFFDPESRQADDGTVTIFRLTLDPHPQPAGPAKSTETTEQTADPHPQPANDTAR